MIKSQPLLSFGPFVVLLSVIITGCAVNPNSLRQQGKQLAFDRNKGNCLACHVIEDGESPGNIGPPLSDLSARFKTPQQLKQQIRDASIFNSETSMPPYGRHNILTDEELDHIVDYLWSLE